MENSMGSDHDIIRFRHVSLKEQMEIPDGITEIVVDGAFRLVDYDADDSAFGALKVDVNGRIVSYPILGITMIDSETCEIDCGTFKIGVDLGIAGLKTLLKDMGVV